jgi:hypothetical protein
MLFYVVETLCAQRRAIELRVEVRTVALVRSAFTSQFICMGCW